MSPGRSEGSPPDFKRAQGPGCAPARSSPGPQMLQAAFRVRIYLSNLALIQPAGTATLPHCHLHSEKSPPALTHEGDLFLLKTLVINEM